MKELNCTAHQTPEVSDASMRSLSLRQRVGCVIYVLDGDKSDRRFLEQLLQPCGAEIRSFDSISAFVQTHPPKKPSCLILETTLPDGSGLDLQRQLSQNGSKLPIVFLTNRNEARPASLALKSGAVDYLVKPTDAYSILTATHQALAVDIERLEMLANTADEAKRSPNLTARELSVLKLINTGLLNKQIGFELGISELTVKVHRRQIMRKMEAKTVVDLIRKYDILARRFSTQLAAS